MARETGWTLEYIYAMDVYDFIGFIEDFKKWPTLYEIARSSVLMPGDKGFTVDASTRRKAMENVVKQSGHAPEWFKRGHGRLQLLTAKGKPQHG